MNIDHDETVAHYLAKLAHRIGSVEFSIADRYIVRQRMLDAIASAFIGIESDVFDDLVALCPKAAIGCSWPGSGTNRINPVDGGMIWAFAIHGSVFDDGSREGACHPGSVVIPTIIALSEDKGWEAIDKATIAGYDIMIRLARGGNPEFTRKGFHPTSICAPFGAAAAASVLFAHDLSTTQNALCLAALSSCGLIAAFKQGRTQPLQVAWGVRNGILAAMLAGKGATGYSRIFEDGFYPAYLGHGPDPPVDHPLKNEYAIRGSYLKAYPGCRHLHPSIDALDKILSENRVDCDQIKKVEVKTYKAAVEAEIHDLEKRGDAYFNIPYALSARMLFGKNDYDAFDERHFSNEQIIRLMERIEVHLDPYLESHYPDQRGAILAVHTVDEKVFCGEVTHALGEPENPLPASVTIKKFRNAAHGLLNETNMVTVERLLDVTGINDRAQNIFETLSKGENRLTKSRPNRATTMTLDSGQAISPGRETQL